jgi:hypothetical protein
MPAGQSSLQEAMARIMGAPAGGTPALQSQNAPSYSSKNVKGTPKTSLEIANTPFDPFAGQQAEIAALKAQTAALGKAAPLSTPSSASAAPAFQWTPTGGANLQNQYLGYYNQNVWNQPWLNTPKAGQVEGGAAQGLFYNPTGTKGGFQVMSSEALRNPTVYGNVRTMAKNPVADKAWYDMLAQAPVKY